MRDHIRTRMLNSTGTSYLDNISMWPFVRQSGTAGPCRGSIRVRILLPVPTVLVQSYY